MGDDISNLSDGDLQTGIARLQDAHIRRNQAFDRQVEDIRAAHPSLAPRKAALRSAHEDLKRDLSRIVAEITAMHNRQKVLAHSGAFRLQESDLCGLDLGEAQRRFAAGLYDAEAIANKKRTEWKVGLTAVNIIGNVLSGSSRKEMTEEQRIEANRQKKIQEENDRQAIDAAVAAAVVGLLKEAEAAGNLPRRRAMLATLDNLGRHQEVRQSLARVSDDGIVNWIARSEETLPTFPRLQTPNELSLFSQASQAADNAKVAVRNLFRKVVR